MLLHQQVRTHIRGHALVLLLGVFATVATPVVLQVVNTPAVVGLCILLFMVNTSEISATGKVTGRTVDTELQSALVEPVAKSLHRGELLIHGNGAVGITFGGFPSVVDIHVAVTVVCQAFFYECLSRRHHLLLRDAEPPAVPGVPTHWRGECNLRAHLQREQLLGATLGVLCRGGEGNLCGMIYTAAEHTLLCQIQSCGQVVGCNLDGLLTRHAEAENHGRTGTNAKHRGGVEARSGRSGRRQQELQRTLALNELAALGVHIFGTGHIAFGLVVGKRKGDGFALANRNLTGEGSFNGTRLAVNNIKGDSSHLISGIFIIQLQGTQRLLSVGGLGELHPQSIGDIGNAYGEGTAEQATRFTCIIYAHSDDILLIPADATRLGVDRVATAGVPCRLVASLVAMEATGLTYQLAVEVCLVGVISTGQVKDHGLLLIHTLHQRTRNGQVDTIPHKGIVETVALVIPRLGNVHFAPVGISSLGLCPVHVVALMEAGFSDGDVLCYGSQHTTGSQQR